MLQKLICLALVALVSGGALRQLGEAQAKTISERTAPVWATPSSPTLSSPTVTLTTRADAAGVAAVKQIRGLARRVASGSTDVDIVEEIATIARRNAGVSVFDKFLGRARNFPRNQWEHRLIPGIDPDASWRDLDIISVDLEGKTGEPTQIGLVEVSRREIGNELTIRLTPSNGESTPKATRLRLLDTSKEVSEAGAFSESSDYFSNFARDRVPLAFNHQGDLRGLMREWRGLGTPAEDRLFLVDKDIEWIDVENWARMFSFGDHNSLGDVHRRVMGESLAGQHVGVNDARGAARVLYRLAEENEDMPKTYGELVQFQMAWRAHRKEFTKLQRERLEAAIELDIRELTEVFEREFASLNPGTHIKVRRHVTAWARRLQNGGQSLLSDYRARVHAPE